MTTIKRYCNRKHAAHWGMCLASCYILHGLAYVLAVFTGIQLLP